MITSPNGLVTVTGGKLTTYRRMAADTVDVVARHVSGRRVAASPTRRLPLVGAPSRRDGDGLGGPAALAARPGLNPAVLTHLAGRHGSETPDVLALCDADPGLGDPLVPGLPYLRAEAVWAVRREMAHTLTDVMARRTRALILDREATASAAAEVAALLGPELGWDGDERARQVAAFEHLVEAERRANRANRASGPNGADPPAPMSDAGPGPHPGAAAAATP